MGLVTELSASKSKRAVPCVLVLPLGELEARGCGGRGSGTHGLRDEPRPPPTSERGGHTEGEDMQSPHRNPAPPGLHGQFEAVGVMSWGTPWGCECG